MSSISLNLRAGALLALGLALSATAKPAMAQEDAAAPAWYGFIGGPRVCDAVNPDGWCVAWHWDLKDSDYQKAQRSKASRRAMARKIRAQDGQVNFRAAEPKVFVMKGDSLVEIPSSPPPSSPSEETVAPADSSSVP